MVQKERLDKPGYVVVRWNAFTGRPYVRTGSVYATKLGARLQVVNKQREQVVPWQGTQADTVEYVRKNHIRPMRSLP
ncbi:hypothetical protein SEA_NANOSMITE_125 [Mycobacterium phage Nanosmite]|nr:hypothetical protein SEA_NANOSMITE_125 [Mycobacterium phage Nanosmite]